MTEFQLNDTTAVDIIKGANGSTSMVFYDLSEGRYERYGYIILDTDAYEKMREILP